MIIRGIVKTIKFVIDAITYAAALLLIHLGLWLPAIYAVAFVIVCAVSGVSILGAVAALFYIGIIVTAALSIYLTVTRKKSQRSKKKVSAYGSSQISENDGRDYRDRDYRDRDYRDRDYERDRNYRNEPARGGDKKYESGRRRKKAKARDYESDYYDRDYRDRDYRDRDYSKYDEPARGRDSGYRDSYRADDRRDRDYESDRNYTNERDTNERDRNYDEPARGDYGAKMPNPNATAADYGEPARGDYGAKMPNPNATAAYYGEPARGGESARGQAAQGNGGFEREHLERRLRGGNVNEQPMIFAMRKHPDVIVYEYSDRLMFYRVGKKRNSGCDFIETIYKY